MNGTIRILVVDDDQNMREMLELYLGAKGHGVALAASGHEAIALLSTQSFDAAVVDWQMTGIGGREVLLALRKTQPGAHAWLSTGYGEDLVAAADLGDLVRGVFRKPYRIQDLEEALRKAILDGSKQST